MNKKEHYRKETLKKKKQAMWQKGLTLKDILRELDNKENDKLNIASIDITDIFGIAGIYFLFKNKELKYIGESACIITRISRHVSSKNFDSFKIHCRESDEKKRKKIEKRLINKHRPVLNITHNNNMSFKTLDSKNKRVLRG